MPFKPGVSGNPDGRPKGRTETEEIRSAFRDLIAANLDNLNKWIREIAEDNPFRAIELLIKLSVFVLPKLQTVEVKDRLSQLNDQEIKELTNMLIHKMKANEIN